MPWYATEDSKFTITMSNYIQKDARIFVAGHRGLAGSAIVRKLRSLGIEIGHGAEE